MSKISIIVIAMLAMAIFSSGCLDSKKSAIEDSNNNTEQSSRSVGSNVKKPSFQGVNDRDDRDDRDLKIASETKIIGNEPIKKVTGLPTLALIEQNPSESLLMINLHGAAEIYGMQIELSPADSIAKIKLSQELDPNSLVGRNKADNKMVIFAFPSGAETYFAQEFALAVITKKSGSEITVMPFEFSDRYGNVLAK